MVTSTTGMEGAANVRSYLRTYLAQDLPTRILKYRNLWDLDDARLPDPALIIDHEPLKLDHWPTVIAMVDRMAGINQTEYDEDTSDPEYRARYVCRIYVWVRGEPYGDYNGDYWATESRDRLVTVVREAIMDHPALASFDRTVHCEPKVDVGSIHEEFSELTHINGQRFLAGAYVGFDINITETVARDTLGTATLFPLIVDLMEKVPNAPMYVLGVAGDQQVALTWSAPSWDGGGYPITGYKIEQSTDDGSSWSTAVADTASSSPAYTVTGLTNGTGYVFRVSAINSQGTGATSASSVEYTPTA